MTEKFDAVMDSCKAGLRGLLEPARVFLDVFSSPWVSMGCILLVFATMLTVSMIVQGREARRLLRQPRTMAVCALMIALNIVLGYFSIWVSGYLRIGFGFVTQPIVALLFGPVVCCITGVAQDILSYLLNPAGGAYMPAYSLCVGISGMLYGLMLYRKPVRIGRVFLTKLLVIVLGNILLNTIALAPTAGSGFVGILPARLIKNLLLLPIQTVVVYGVLKLKFLQR